MNTRIFILLAFLLVGVVGVSGAYLNDDFTVDSLGNYTNYGFSYNATGDSAYSGASDRESLFYDGFDYEQGENLTVLVRPDVSANVNSFAAVWINASATGTGTSGQQGYACGFRGTYTSDLWFLNANVAWVTSGSFSWTNENLYWVKVNYDGSTFKCKAWADGDGEPSTWAISHSYSTAPGATGAKFGVGNFGLTSAASTMVVEQITYGTAPPPGNTTYVSLTAVDAYDGSSLNTFNASLTNTSGTYTFSTTNGTINTNIDDTTGPYNITFNAANYFSNSTPSVDVSSGSVQGSLAQAFVSFSCFEKHTNTSLNCTQPGPLPRQADSYTDQVNVTGYHPVDYSYTLSALDYYRPVFYTDNWVNPEHLNDGDFSTFAVSSGGMAYAYWNYTRVDFDEIRLKDGNGDVNVTLPDLCAAENPIQIRVWSSIPEIGISQSKWHCYDGTDWVEIRAGGTGSRNVYEQAFANSEPALDVYGFYDHELTVTAEDYLGASLSNFTLWVNSSLVNYTVTDNNTGSVVLGLLQGYNYTIQISENIPSGAERNNSIETAIFDVPADPSTSSESYQFNLTFPSLTITVLDEDSGVNAPGNTTVTFTASNSSFSKTIVNGTGVFNASDSIPSGSYSVRFENDDYADRVYNLTYNREFPQSLTAYLVNTSSPNVVFVLEDRDTRNVVEGATITVQRFINGTLTTVNVLESDITGRTAFDYLSNQEYRFQITHPDYTAKNFTLNPILFSSYTLLMDSPSTAGETTGDYAGIGYVFNTARFVEGRAADLSATVSDASGGLVSYGFNITVNGALIDTQTGSNAYGSVLTSNVVIPETPYNGTAVIDYYYQLSDGNHYKFRFIYAVEQVNAYSNQTWVGNKDIAADIPILDRVVVVTIILAAVGALAFTFGGLTTAAIGMMLIMGFFSFTGFINPWIFAVPIIGLFFLLIGREAQ